MIRPTALKCGHRYLFYVELVKHSWCGPAWLKAQGSSATHHVFLYIKEGWAGLHLKPLDCVPPHGRDKVWFHTYLILFSSTVKVGESCFLLTFQQAGSRQSRVLFSNSSWLCQKETGSLFLPVVLSFLCVWQLFPSSPKALKHCLQVQLWLFRSGILVLRPLSHLSAT